VTAALATGRYDRVVCDFLVPAVNLPSRLPCASVLFTHNVEAEIWRRHADTADSFPRRLLYRQQWRRMRRFERRTLARFDRVLAVSDVDRDTFARLYPGALDAPAAVIPTGVDTTYFTPAPTAPAGHRLVFTGSMDWLPNVDGVLHFCRDILPLIRRQVPDVAFTIVGRAPTHTVRNLADEPGVSVTGRVDDVRPYLAEAAAYVVPLRIGGGTRLKIFEAMAAGRAVVSTSIGAEGLPTEPGRHLLLADAPESFAASVVALLTRPALRHSVEGEARALVANGYDWRHAAAHLERAIVDTSPRTRQRRAASPWTYIKRTTHP
jgi:glycosyltransferase involved in cell wall biosynthesis